MQMGSLKDLRVWAKSYSRARTYWDLQAQGFTKWEAGKMANAGRVASQVANFAVGSTGGMLATGGLLVGGMVLYESAK